LTASKLTAGADRSMLQTTLFLGYPYFGGGEVQLVTRRYRTYDTADLTKLKRGRCL